MRLPRTLLLPVSLTVLLLAAATPASADATLFVGSNTTPSNRTVKGFSLGVSLLVVGVEFEYAKTSEDADKAAKNLDTLIAAYHDSD